MDKSTTTVAFLNSGCSFCRSNKRKKPACLVEFAAKILKILPRSHYSVHSLSILRSGHTRWMQKTHEERTEKWFVRRCSSSFVTRSSTALHQRFSFVTIRLIGASSSAHNSEHVQNSFKQRFRILGPTTVATRKELQRLLHRCLHGTRRCWLQVYLGRHRQYGISVKRSDLQCFWAKGCVKNGNLKLPNSHRQPRCFNSSYFSMFAMHTLGMRSVYVRCASCTLYIRCELAIASPEYRQKLGAQRRKTNFIVRLARSARVHLVWPGL